MIKVVVAGSKGRMGQEIMAMALNHSKLFSAIMGFDKGDDPSIISKGDVLIDFTTPEATLEHIQTAVELKKPMVIGTTGMKEPELRKIKEASTQIAIIHSSNMSLGLNVLVQLVGQAAKLLKPMNMTIDDAHHRHKKDAPSGSAKMLGEALASAMGLDFSKSAVFEGGLDIHEEEAKGKIFFNRRRSSEIVGEHTVFLGGWGEELRLGHAAHDRKPFAAGALQAAEWIIGKKPGLYSMKDVLKGLSYE